MAINLDNTRILLAALSRSYPPSTLFRDLFFPNEIISIQKQVDIEYKKGGRKMAPFVVPGSSGKVVGRDGFVTKEYTPPMMRPKRVLTVEDLQKRMFGENVYSDITPEQRAATYMASDMADLIDMNTRRIEWMCAQLLINGKFDVSGYADDGELVVSDTVSFPDWGQKTTLTGSDTWDNPGADIYGDIDAASSMISRNSVMVPTVAVMSKNIVQYLMNNNSIMKWLAIPNSQNLSLMSLQPRITSPEVVRVGYIQSLNLELYAYDGIYHNDQGAVSQYLPNNHMIIGVPGRGRQLFGAITQGEPDGQFYTYSAKNVPKSFMSPDGDKKTLSMASRCVPCPEFIDDWYTLKVK